MKIIFGKYKGRNLLIGKNERMRPTTSIAKDKIFNMLTIDKTTTVLDIFGGTGALGFEALSLGACEVIWTDNNRNCVKSINETVASLNLPKEKYKAFISDFRNTLKKKQKFDVIFVDPPFSIEKYFNEVLDLIVKHQNLKPEGIIVMEKPIKMVVDSLNKYKIKVNKHLGQKEILFLIWK